MRINADTGGQDMYLFMITVQTRGEVKPEGAPKGE